MTEMDDQNQLRQLKEQESAIQMEISFKKAELSTISKQIQSIQARLKSKKREPSVSDHAVIRYLERKNGVSFDDVRNEILTPHVIQSIKLGAKNIKSEGMRYVITDSTITTILYEDDRYCAGGR